MSNEVKPSPYSELDLVTLQHCLSICDFALEHYKGAIVQKIRREIAELIRLKKSE